MISNRLLEGGRLARPHRSSAARQTPLVVLLILVTGCGFFSRKKNNFFSLEPMAQEEVITNLTGLPIGIDVLELPPGLDRREIVVRKADQKLDVRGTDIWAGPLEQMVLHTLAFDLARRLPPGMIILPGQSKPASMRSIDLILEEFAAGPEPVLVLDARWTLQGGATRRERIELNLDSLESPAIAAGMSRALAALADRMAEGLGAGG